MRFNQAEKYEIIRLVEDSEIGPIRTIKELGINKSTFYNWYGKYRQGGYDALGANDKNRNSFWNKASGIRFLTKCAPRLLIWPLIFLHYHQENWLIE